MGTWLQRLVLFVLGFTPLWCVAVQPYSPLLADPILEPWRWREEEVLQGLGVHCMDEASDGTLWFGNVGSIAHYDGSEVTLVEFGDELLAKITHQKGPVRAKALKIMPDGSLLLVIGQSVVLYNDGAWKILIQDVGVSWFEARFLRSRNGTIWLIVPDGLWCISADLGSFAQVMAVPKGGRFLSCCMDPAGDLWVLEQPPTKISKLIHVPVRKGRASAQRNWQEYQTPFGGNERSPLLESGANGVIWYLSDDSDVGLQSFDSRAKKWTSIFDYEMKKSVYSLLELNDGSMLAGLSGELLRINSRGEQTLYPIDLLDVPRVPLSLFKTMDGRLWVIGRIGYVYSLDIAGDEWQTFNGLNFQCETAAGVQWFVSWTSKTVVSHNLRTGTWKQYGIEDQLIDKILYLYQSSHGLIWGTGSHEGRAAIVVFDGKKWTRHLHPTFTHSIQPYSVFESKDGTVWFGASGSVFKQSLSPGGALQYGVNGDGSVELIKHHAPPDFPYRITAFEQTADGVIWLGSTSIASYDGEKTVTDPFSELSIGNTVAMTLDADQSLWVAKEHQGVYRRRDGGWCGFSVEDGLLDLKLTDLLTLQDGSLLAASHRGISRFDGSSWTANTYGKHFGMLSRWSGIQQSTDGSIWLNYALFERRSKASPSTMGYCTIRHRPENKPPNTVIESYLARVSQPGNTYVTWSAHDPWSSTLHSDLQYSWRLNGGDWSPFSFATEQTFLDLSSGKHRLEVRSRDRAFNVDPTPASAEFYVVPPIWMQPWFLSMVFVLIGLASMLFVVLMRGRLQRENHLLEMDRLKTGFFTNISHELRTPMTVISARLDMMLKSEADAQKRDVLSLLIRNAGRISTLITQLLDFRKIEAGKLLVETTQGDLVQVLKGLLVTLQPLAEDSQISCRLIAPDACPGIFDFDKVEKVATNLIANSIKYSEAGGEVYLKLDLERTNQGDPVLKLVVEDQGVGISQKHIDHIFDRFYRVSEESIAIGAGIGLNLARELVDLMGGIIRADSPIHPDPKRPGTRFTVMLPYEQGAKATEPVSEKPPARSVLDDIGQPDKPVAGEEIPLILVVEDDFDIREVVVDGLDLFYRVETAENGKVGLQMAKELVPDLIITDVMMPVMDGNVLCEKLKTAQETSHIPVFMLTAKSSVVHQLEGLKTGADDYITKPFHMEVLQVRIANMLESRRKMREKFSTENNVLAPSLPENSLDKEFMEKVVVVLEEHYTDWDFKLDAFAAATHMSLSSLKRKLKAVADRTPGDLLNEFRMMKAAEELKNSPETITEICYRIGCQDFSNFSRLFKKYHGVSPSKFRETNPPR